VVPAARDGRAGREGRVKALLSHLRERAWLYLPLGALFALVLGLASQWISPLPPRTIVFAAGPKGGMFEAFAERYRDLLAHEGIRLEILTTRGSVQNLELIRAEPRRVDAALVQGGVGSAGEDEGIEALGSVFYEPVFVFVRRSLGARSLADLRERRIAIGPQGSGTRALALQLLTGNGFELRPSETLTLTGADSAKALADGEIDAAFFVIAHPLPTLSDLFANPDLELLSFRRADAYRMRFPFLSSVVLPAGAIDLALDRPERDISLVAPAGALIVHESMHPALKNLLARVAREVHGGPQLFAPAGRFPSVESLDYPLNSYAKRLIESGPSAFARFLPFWVAVWGERLLILMLPLLGLLIPLFRLAPPLYRWNTERRIYRWYRNLGRLEAEARASPDAAARARIARELDDLQERVGTIRVPLSYARQLYDLREHIGFVRGLLGRVEAS
jgi:TRAP transporter TAXI family solute receptor